ncbi:MAG: hypothetical protein JWO92_789 [Chitinophagaceae bacterium]|nr:hypothetical protein [Chitinophagaceae bacterium]
MKTFATVEEYLSDVPGDKRKALEHLRKTIWAVVPKAEEYISYGMPTFKHNGPLVSYAAFKEHCSLFPWNATLVKKYAEELKAYKTSKGTIQFTVDKPLPVSLVKTLIKERMKENEAKVLAKKK